MSYLALARKWRPRTFSQLVGQEHINKALINSLNQQRIHHAYLFTGTRGVGKTSIARLLAKALNCEKGISADPCLTCEACAAIEQGRFIDLLEIDGASRTRVEDTRELLDNVQYSPTNGRFKIYLIDEVHMLSQHSFNALLKTLEEPPPHVKFLLATTDPQKLPVTVLSRCLQFNLKHLSADLINHHLQTILQSEKLAFETEALEILAKAAKGSMRDALSLLDQAIATCNSTLRTDEIKNLLGYTQQDYAMQLLQALVALDAQEIIHLCRKIALEGGHFSYVLDELLSYLHQITIIQSLNSDDSLTSSSPEIIGLAKKLLPEDTQLFYQIGIKGTTEIHLAPSLAIGFEMLLLRMLVFRPAPAGTVPLLAYETKKNQGQSQLLTNGSQSPSQRTLEKMPCENPSSRPLVSEENSPESALIEEISPFKPTTAAVKDSPRDPAEASLRSNSEEKLAETSESPPAWSLIIKQLKLSGLSLNAAENAEFLSKSGHEIFLRITRGHESLFTPQIIQRIEKALANYYKETIKIVLTTGEALQSPAQQNQMIKNQRQLNAEAELQNDVLFQRLQQEFSATVLKNSIVALEDEL